MKSRIANLPSGIGVSRTKNGHGKEFWRVRVGKRFTGGSTLKRDFTTLSAAREWIFGSLQQDKAAPGSLMELKSEAGRTAFGLSAGDLNEAANALKRCREAELSLTAAVDFALRHARPPAGTITFSDAIDLALAEKGKSKRPSYIADLGKRWRRFAKWLPPAKRLALNSVTRMDIVDFLADCDLQPSGERNQLRNLSVLFAWAKNKGKIADNPCTGIKTENSVEDRAVRILSIGELKKMLSLAQHGFFLTASPDQEKKWRKKFSSLSLKVSPGELVPEIALGCFAGLRPAEAERLDWNMITLGDDHPYIDLPACIAKDRTRRIVDIPPNLAKWLRPFRHRRGLIIPKNHRRKLWALRMAMNWEEWPIDILRHSFGSYHLAKYRDSACTAEQMGHKNARMLYAHYREVVKDRDAVAAYWEHCPGQAEI